MSAAKSPQAAYLSRRIGKLYCNTNLLYCTKLRVFKLHDHLPVQYLRGPLG